MRAVHEVRRSVTILSSLSRPSSRPLRLRRRVLFPTDEVGGDLERALVRRKIA
jgi:hypothetical protein